MQNIQLPSRTLALDGFSAGFLPARSTIDSGMIFLEGELEKRDDRLRRMEAAREQQRKYAAEEAEKKSLKEKRAEKQAAKATKKKNSTSESGRVGDRPYARGRSYDPEHYGE